MNDNARTIVVGMMQTPPYDRMFEQSRRVYSGKGISPTLHTCGGQSGDKGIGGAVKHVRTTQIIRSTFAQAYEERGITYYLNKVIPITLARLYLSPLQGYTYYLNKVIPITSTRLYLLPPQCYSNKVFEPFGQMHKLNNIQNSFSLW